MTLPILPQRTTSNSVHISRCISKNPDVRTWNMSSALWLFLCNNIPNGRVEKSFQNVTAEHATTFSSFDAEKWIALKKYFLAVLYVMALIVFCYLLSNLRAVLRSTTSFSDLSWSFRRLFQFWENVGIIFVPLKIWEMTTLFRELKSEGSVSLWRWKISISAKDTIFAYDATSKTSRLHILKATFCDLRPPLMWS